MILVADSDWFLLCPTTDALRGGSASTFGVAAASARLSFGVPARAGEMILSHGVGDDRDSIGADTGVGSVEAVAADLGVVMAADRGVKGVLASSVRAERMPGSSELLPERRRVNESWRVRRGMTEFWVGMTKGAKVLGERGSGSGFRESSRGELPVTASSGFSSKIWSFERVMQSARC